MIELFASIPYAAIGGVATRAYMPQRTTDDLDVLVPASVLQEVRLLLRAAGGTLAVHLAFPDSTLGLRGEAWEIQGSPPLDLIWSDQPWVTAALQGAVTDETGLRIVPLWALVALKMDAARGIDQGDLSRMLGLASDPQLALVRDAIRALLPDAIEDLESYVELGRLEMNQLRGHRGHPDTPGDSER